MRSSLATCPSLTSSFTDAARKRLEQTHTKTPVTSNKLFESSNAGYAVPGPALHDVLSSVRSLYGVGLGTAGLQKLTEIVNATTGLRWERNGEMDNVLAAIDADIAQAIQSTKEELLGGASRESVIATVNDLKAAVEASRLDTKRSNGDFPFERAADSLAYWHL